MEMVFILQKMSDEEKQMVKSQLIQCEKTEDVTEEQVDQFLAGKNLNTKEAKCLAACALEQFGIVRKPEHIFFILVGVYK